jgi:hypothetical protein
VLAAHLAGRQPGSVFLQNLDDLLFGESALTHVGLPKERTLPKTGALMVGCALRQCPYVTLRRTLGDWRETASVPDRLIDDPVARSEFYVDHDFDAEITAFPARAFDEITEKAGIVPSDDCAADENEARSVRVFKQLLAFKRRLREFIDRAMTDAFEEDWPKHRLPNGMFDA